MPGGQSRGLVQASITKGWDPRKIEGGGSISAFDVDPGTLPHRFVGRIPGGPPAHETGMADGYDVNLDAIRFDAPVPWRTPHKEG